MARQQESQPSRYSVSPQRAKEILNSLLEDAPALITEALASPKRSEWKNRARVALERSGVSDSRLQAFDALQTIAGNIDTTDEEMRWMENSNLASLEGILRSVILQLDWKSDEGQERDTTSSHETPKERSSQSAGARFVVNRANQFVLDGELFSGAKVWETESGFRNLSISNKDLGKLGELSFQELRGYFDSIQIFVAEGGEDLDWSFGSIQIDLFRNAAQSIELVEVAFSIDFELEFWSKPYNISEIATAIENVLEKGQTSFSYWQQNQNTCIEGFGVSIQMSMAETLSDAVRYWPELYPLAFLIREELGEEQATVNMAFEFPPAIKSACEQYLLYFVQFLRDLGIEANAEIKEQASNVLFSVTPNDKDQALEKIREALQVYLGLPHLPEFSTVAAQFGDTAVSQLQANVYHLRSQIMLAKAALQLNSATIAAKDQQIALLQERIDLREFQPKREEKKEDKEDLVKDMVAIKKYDFKFLEINLPELLRKLKRRFQ